jgi:large subunit ribosomal protein L17
MLSQIGPRFSNRKGGYTRIIKLGKRFGDDAPTAILEWSETVALVPVQKIELKKEKTPVKPKKAVKKKITKVVAKKPVKKVIKAKAK